MSSNNNDNAGAAAVFGLLVATVMAMAIFVAVIIGFITFVLTLWCLFAWNKPRRIGSITIQSHEARHFILNGLIGMGILPAFVWICGFFVELDPSIWNYHLHMAAAGYVLGSLGVEYLFSQLGSAAPVTISRPALPVVHQTPRPPQIQRPVEPFRYASWDDEEELR